MNQLNYDCSADRLLPHVTLGLEEAGFSVKWTFDLRSALASIPDCPCPYHTTTHCDCQYLVLMVSRESGNLVALILHGRQARSWLRLADTSSQAERDLKDDIVRVLEGL